MGSGLLLIHDREECCKNGHKLSGFWQVIGLGLSRVGSGVYHGELWRKSGSSSVVSLKSTKKDVLCSPQLLLHCSCITIIKVLVILLLLKWCQKLSQKIHAKDSSWHLTYWTHVSVYFRLPEAILTNDCEGKQFLKLIDYRCVCQYLSCKYNNKVFHYFLY